MVYMEKLLFPIVCAEWHEREAALVGKVAYFEVLEAIANCHRMLDFR